MSLLYKGGQPSRHLTLLWNNAQTSEYENATIELWSYYLNKNVFMGEEWNVAPEQPPVDETRRRVDLVVKFHDINNVIRVLCFIEAKSPRAEPKQIRDAEAQAIDACQRHIDVYDQNNLYVLTIFGTRAKPWVFERGDTALVPMDPEDELATILGEAILR